MKTAKKKSVCRAHASAVTRAVPATVPNRLHGYAVTFEKTDSGYSCFARSLPGCISAGDTKNECRRNMKDAIELHLEGMLEDGETPPPRDGRAAPRPARLKGRRMTIPNRISAAAAGALESISLKRGISKTEALEYSLLEAWKRVK